MLHIKGKTKKVLSTLLAVLLLFSNAGLVNTAYAVDLQPGEVYVDKHRSTYELSPGDTTDISLLVQTEGTTITPVIDLVIAIDISNSMVNNSDGSSTVMELTQTAAKSLASQLLTASSSSRIALVRYGDFASVYDFANSQWIKLDNSTSSASLIGNNLYTSNYSALATRIDNIRSNLNSGYIKWNLTDSWDWLTDQGGTTTEAGLVMTTLVAQEATQESFAVFMSDGVPTSRMISRTNGADGRYGISRDGSGTDTSTLEKSEAITAANALSSLSDTTSYSIAVTLGLSGVDLTNSNDVMSAVASDPDNYFATSTPATDVNSIYISIGQTIIDRVAQNAQVVDIVPEYFTVSNLPADISATAQADGTTRLVWTIGDLMAGETTSGYTLTLKPGYYGILDTNVSAVLSYTDHFMGAADPNTEADKIFPIPEIKAQPRAADDAYTTPDNYSPYNVPTSILVNDINSKVDNSPYDDRPGADYTPLADRAVQDYSVVIVDPLLLDGSEGTITGFDYSTGLFTYLPNPARPRDPGQTTYSVDFTYKLVTTDAAGAYVSNIATVTITVPVPEFQVAVIKRDVVDEAPLAGVVFGLYDGNTAGATLLETLPATDATGYAVSANTYLAGTYYLKEISTINGYELNPNYHPVVITAQQQVGVVTITVDNNRTPYPIGVIKRDAVSESPLAGVVFGLYDGNTGGATLLETLPATDAGGYAETVNDYAPGTYYLKEISTINGYELNPDYHAVVVVVGAGKAVTITVDNNRTPYPIGVTKRDAISESPLAGVIFGLYDGNTDDATLLETLPATDAGGYAETVNDYAPGTYYLKEISTINGYELNPDYHEVVVAIGAGGAVTITVYNNRTPYPIGVTKRDVVSGAPLTGVIFGLYDGNTSGATLLETLPATNASGYAETVNAYAPGTYYLKEISTINGYELNPGYHAVVVAIGAGETAVITVNNSRTPYPIGVTKRDAVSSAPLAGVIFGLYDGNTAGAALLETLPATDASGYAETVNDYAPGTYYLKEISTINGYELNPDYHAVVVAIGAGEAAVITVNNSRTPYPIGVIKLDAVSESPLAGVIFGLYDGNTAGAALLETLPATDASGYAETVNDYAPGTYYLKEISTINGYELNPDYHEVVVAIGEGEAVTITVDNSRTLYPIEILKLDTDSETGLAGVVFRIYREVLGEKVPVSGDLITNETGIATSDPLTPGLYFVIEISAPAGYILDDTYYPVTVNIGQENGKATITIYNGRMPYRIQIIKTDARDGETGLPGATFELREAIENSQDPQAPTVGDLLEVLTTDSNGEALTTNLYLPGSYFLVETSAPAGFRLIADPILITIDIGSGTDGIFSVTVTNEFIYTPGISVEKLVANDSQGDPLSKLSDLDIGENARYEVVITNTGNAPLIQVVLTDDQAEVGSAVTLQPGGNTVWLLGTGGIATLNLGSLDVGESVKVIYYYTAVAGDVESSPIINTVYVTGNMTPDLQQNDDAGPVSDSDYAAIVVDEIPLVVAEIDVTKMVENTTQNGVKAELAGGYVGDSFKYTVTVTNTGSADLTNVVLTDDKAEAGSPVTNVTTAATEYWQADGSNPAYIVVGDLAAGQSVTYTYMYTSSEADLSGPRINTANGSGTVTSTLNDPEPVIVEDEDSAIVAVDEIPQTGESGTLPYIGIVLLLAMVVLVRIRRGISRRSRKQE